MATNEATVGPLTAAEREEMAAGAKVATPGPWWQGDTEEHQDGDADCVYVRDDDGVWRMAGPLVHEADAAHIARMCPETTLRLLAALAAAEARAEAAERIVTAARAWLRSDRAADALVGKGQDDAAEDECYAAERALGRMAEALDAMGGVP